jgi:hypothetical protein
MRVNKTRFTMILLAAAYFAAPSNIFGQNDVPERIRIAALFGGVFTNKYSATHYGQDITLKDSGFISGTYLQWIETEKGQANVYGYWSPSVNYSRVLGLHGNADGYFLGGSWGSCVAGFDFEEININMDAGSHVSGLNSFKMQNNVFFMMARAGARFKINPSDGISIVVFPYAGATRERVSGKIEVVTPPMGPMPSMEVEDKFSDTDYYFSWGTNINARISNYAELILKYLGRAKKNDYMHSVTAQANIYLSRNAALFYQFKHMQMEDGYNRFHLFGVGIVF